MEEYNYDLLAGTITMEEITYNEKKHDILRRIKENDIQKVAICDSRMPSRDNFTYSMHYESHEMGWLGYFIGRSSSVKELHAYQFVEHTSSIPPLFVVLVISA